MIHYAGMANITEQSSYGSDGVTVTLELAEVDPMNTYHIIVIPPSPSMFNASTGLRAMLTMSYNTMYNVSVLAESPCGRENVTYFSDLFYYGEFIVYIIL